MSELGNFLRARRAARTPEAAGLPGGGRRRAPGLRREELAAIAGVSVDYLIRLEQGRQDEPSAEVLRALARGLGLAPDERRHLFALASRVDEGAPVPVDAELPAALRRVVDGAHPAPAWVIDRCGDIVAWNSAAEAILGSLGERPNYLRLLLDGRRSVWADPSTVVRDAVAFLRLATHEIRDSARVRSLVEDLCGYPEFDRLWRAHEVAAACSRNRDVEHPVAGRLEFAAHLLTAEGAAFQIVVLEPRTAATAAAWTDYVSGPGATRLRVVRDAGLRTRNESVGI